MASDEVNGIQEELKDLAMRGLVLTAKAQIAELEERFGSIDLRSFLIGGMASSTSAHDLPPFIAAEIMGGLIEALDAHLAAETSVEGAFDDLPVFDPGNGS